MKVAIPSGQDEIVEALLDAAEQLFAQRGTGAVSLRDVAERARLQHSLIFRYIGRKEDLVRAVYERALRRINARLGEDPTVLEIFDALANDRTAARFFVRAALDEGAEGFDTELLDFGPVHRDIVAGQRSGAIVKGIDPDLLYAISLALGMGWILLEPTLLRALGEHRTGRERVRRRVVEVVTGLLAGNLERSPDPRDRSAPRELRNRVGNRARGRRRRV